MYMNKIVTVEMVMSFNPCADEYPRAWVKELIGKGKTLTECLNLQVPASDVVWLLTRPGLLPTKILREFTIRAGLRIYREPNWVERANRWIRDDTQDVSEWEWLASVLAISAMPWTRADGAADERRAQVETLRSIVAVNI
jgi:hypothetical protein